MPITGAYFCILELGNQFPKIVIRPLQSGFGPRFHVTCILLYRSKRKIFLATNTNSFQNKRTSFSIIQYEHQISSPPVAETKSFKIYFNSVWRELLYKWDEWAYMRAFIPHFSIRNHFEWMDARASLRLHIWQTFVQWFYVCTSIEWGFFVEKLHWNFHIFGAKWRVKGGKRERERSRT